MKNGFGVNLRNIREQRNMSQDQLAILLGTSKQVLSRYETGQRTPKITTVQEYADKLGISPDELAGYDAKSKEEKPATNNDDRLSDGLKELTEIWQKMGERERKELLRFARFQKVEQDDEQK